MPKLKWSIRIPPDRRKGGSGPAAFRDIAMTSLTALSDSADAFPPLKSVVGSVLALWSTVERVKTSKERAQALSRRAFEVLEALADAVPDPLNIPGPMLLSIQRFNDVLREATDAMRPLTQRRRFVSAFASLNRDEETLELFSRRLDESFQTFTIASLSRVESQLLALDQKVESEALEIKAQSTHLIAAHQELAISVHFLSIGLF